MRVNQKHTIILFLFFLANTTLFAQDEKISGNIVLQMGANDSMHVVTATLTNIATKQPVKAVQLTFYVQRTFGLMKVADGTTDSTGITSAEFPLTIPPGDPSGKITVVAKVENSDVVNDTSFSTLATSKIPYQQSKKLAASIAGSNAPLWLIIAFTLTVGTVWLFFAYVLYLVYLIKKSAVKSIHN